MRALEFCQLVRAAKGEGEDCVLIVEREESILIALADGAGGTSGGRAAAQAVIRAASEAPHSKLASQWEEFLRSLDGELAARVAGETTAVLLVATSDAFVGASVGDSEALLIHDHEARVLTASQNRKPLLGSGHARPVGFGPIPFRGRLVVGSDGLFKYCSHERLLALAARDPLGAAAAALLGEVTLASGRLQDDIAIVIAQRA